MEHLNRNCSQLDTAIITPDIKRLAEEQLGENEEKAKYCLQMLKRLLADEKKINSRTDDEFLLKFLRARKFDTKATLKLIRNYYSHRKYYSEIYEKYTPEKHLHVMETKLLNYLPLRSPEGYAVFVNKLGQWDPSYCSFEDMMRFGLMCNERAADNPVTQICGMAAIVDMDGLTLTKVLRCSPTLLRCSISALQDCLPIRMKAVHVLNAPKIFSIIFAIIQPLIKAKILNRIYFHGNDPTKLQQYFPAKILPNEFGGTAGTFDNENFYQDLKASQDHFAANLRYGCRRSSLIPNFQ